jgi:5,10-methylenetetrahydromethanopterin reductase
MSEGMRFSIELPPKDPLWRLQIYAHLADRLSFHTIWLSDHYFNRNTVVAASVIAGVTKRLRIGLGIMNPYLYHPVWMAQAAATLSELAPERVSLGIGAGDRLALDSLGIRQVDPVERVREAVRTIRETLRGGADERSRLDFKPWGRIPIYVAAQGEKLLRLAAEAGDGVLINSSWLHEPVRPVRIVREALAGLARDEKDFSVEMEALVSIHEDRQKARKTVKPYVGVVSQGIPQRLSGELGIRPETLSRIREMVLRRNWLEIHRVVPDEMVDLFAIAGNPKHVEERVEDLLGSGLDGVVFGGPLGPTPRRAIIELDRILRGLSR